MIRQRPQTLPVLGGSNKNNSKNNSNSNSTNNGVGNNNTSRSGKKNTSNCNCKNNSQSQSHCHYSKCHFVSTTILFIVLLVMLMMTVQLFLNSLLYGGQEQGHGPSFGGRINNLRKQSNHEKVAVNAVGNSYDVLLKNTINYDIANSNNNGNGNGNGNGNDNIAMLQEQINNLRSEITSLESKSQKYVDDPRFFPFVIRDSRHLTPTQINPNFHIFDYVDLTQAKQPKSRHSQLLHNARLVIDDELELKRKNNNNSKKKKRVDPYAEKYEAPCQVYSVQCYRQKILQVFSYILRNFPRVEYYFYMESDNDLCVPMTMVKDLALAEQRYFINTGIGFSGWIMSREFLHDFIQLYGNATLDSPVTKIKPGTNETISEEPEIRPDVLASYYLTDRQTWTVTRQYWVSHTTLESLGAASLTVKDRRVDETGERMKLDKHLPRCLEPRRGKWKVSRRKPFLDPRDRFGWDYFDYDVCPNELLFPCGGQDQLKKLVADDLRVANETGALAKWKSMEEKKQRQEEAKARKEALEAAAENAAAKLNNNNTNTNQNINILQQEQVAKKAMELAKKKA